MVGYPWEKILALFLLTRQEQDFCIKFLNLRYFGVRRGIQGAERQYVLKGDV